jgi:hypothetical protein
MKTNSMLTKVLMLVSSALMLAAAGIGSAQAASLLNYNPDGTVDGFSLPGISQAGRPNFENTVNVKVQKRGKNGFKLKVRKEGKGSYFNTSTESLKIQNGKYFLDAYFDTGGNFLNGTLKIKGLLDTPLGTAKGTLMTATLGSGLGGGIDFAYTSTLLGFNTNHIVCDSIIDEFVGGCTSNESVYIALQEGGFSPTTKNFKSDGLSVATVPVPAAVWLFGSGLIALVGITRRRKY